MNNLQLYFALRVPVLYNKQVLAFRHYFKALYFKSFSSPTFSKPRFKYSPLSKKTRLGEVRDQSTANKLPLIQKLAPSLVTK